MENKIHPVGKINTSKDAYNFLIQSTVIRNHRTIDYFFVLYLDGKNNVIDFKVVQKRNGDSMVDTFNHILAFDETKNINSLLVVYQPARYCDFEKVKELANQLVDKAFFSLVNIIDFGLLRSPEYYMSMRANNINIPNKHLFTLKQTIRKNEPKEYSQQNLFDMSIDSIKNLIELEYYKIFWADQFVFYELIDIDYKKYDDMRFRSVWPNNLEQPSSKIYLVSVFNEYMKHKNLIMEFIIQSNLYEKYLLYKFDSTAYHNQREQKKMAKTTNLMQIDYRNSIRITNNVTSLSLV